MAYFRNFLVLFPLATSSLIAAAHAQSTPPTITHMDLFQYADGIHEIASCGTVVAAGPTGGNVVWDFSNVGCISLDHYQSDVRYGSGIPTELVSAFPTCGVAIRRTWDLQPPPPPEWNCYALDAFGLERLGTASDALLVTQSMNPPYEELHLPLQYQDSWTTEGMAIEYDLGQPSGQTPYSAAFEVDAWGTITIPAGGGSITHPCLRLKLTSPLSPFTTFFWYAPGCGFVAGASFSSPVGDGSTPMVTQLFYASDTGCATGVEEVSWGNLKQMFR